MAHTGGGGTIHSALRQKVHDDFQQMFVSKDVELLLSHSSRSVYRALQMAELRKSSFASSYSIE